MKQTRTMSLIEAVTNVVVGYVLAIAMQIVVFPWFGIETGLAEHLVLGLAFLGVSLARGYLLRRLFDSIRIYDHDIGGDRNTLARSKAPRFSRPFSRA